MRPSVAAPLEVAPVPTRAHATPPPATPHHPPPPRDLIMQTNTIQPNQGSDRSCPIHKLLEGTGDAAQRSLPARLTILALGLLAYAMFFGTILYAIGFVSGPWTLLGHTIGVPKAINTGQPVALQSALLINGALLMLFVVQHTIMARPRFKRWWTTIVPHAVERSIFVMFASASLMLLFWLWKPLPEAVWNVQTPWLRHALSAVSLLGWGIVFASSFMVSHWDLFGLRQTTMAFIGRDPSPIEFRLVGLYKLVRHPLMLGFLIAFWSTPTMTIGHLFFAGMTTAYILFGTTIEERDLIAHFGDRYLTYRDRVPGLIPFTKLRRSP